MNQKFNPLRFFGIWACIICVLFATYHTITFVQSLTQFGESSVSVGDFPADADDLTPEQFAALAVYFETYDFENYDPADFPAWLNMYPTAGNLTEEQQKPYAGYDWDNYNPADFPTWTDMPATLPEDFDPVEFDIIDYIDSDYLAEAQASMIEMESEDPTAILDYLFGESGSDGFSMDVLFQFIATSDLIRAIIWLAVAIILFIILRTTPH